MYMHKISFYTSGSFCQPVNPYQPLRILNYPYTKLKVDDAIPQLLQVVRPRLGNPQKNVPKNAGWIDKIRLVFQLGNKIPWPLKYGISLGF